MTADSRWTRRDFLSTTALGIIGMGISGSSVGADERFAYIGTYTNTGHSDGIYRLVLEQATGGRAGRGGGCRGGRRRGREVGRSVVPRPASDRARAVRRERAGVGRREADRRGQR